MEWLKFHGCLGCPRSLAALRFLFCPEDLLLIWRWACLAWTPKTRRHVFPLPCWTSICCPCSADRWCIAGSHQHMDKLQPIDVPLPSQQKHKEPCRYSGQILQWIPQPFLPLNCKEHWQRGWEGKKRMHAYHMCTHTDNMTNGKLWACDSQPTILRNLFGLLFRRVCLQDSRTTGFESISFVLSLSVMLNVGVTWWNSTGSEKAVSWEKLGQKHTHTHTPNTLYLYAYIYIYIERERTFAGRFASRGVFVSSFLSWLCNVGNHFSLLKIGCLLVYELILRTTPTSKKGQKGHALLCV